MAELGRLQRFGREAGGLLQRQRAHLGGRPGRAAADERQRGAAVDPAHEVVGGGVRFGQQALHLEARPAPSAGRRPARSSTARAAAKVMVEGPYSSPARVSSAMSAAAASVLAEPLVTAAHGRAALAGQPLDQADQLGALARLADADQQRVRLQQRGRRKCSSSAVSSIEHETPLPAERGDGRIAGVVGAAHAGEQDRAGRPRRPRAAARSWSACSASPRPARRSASGWPAISATNLSGNFPNDFTSRQDTVGCGRREGRGDRRRQHLHARAGGGLRPAPRRAAGGGAGAARHRPGAAGHRRRAGRQDPARSSSSRGG